MPEGNGSEREARLSQIENQQEEFRRDMKNLLIAQVIQKSQIDDLLKVTEAHSKQFEREAIERREKDAALDKRLAALIGGIGDLISRIPPQSLR
jgi:hypothetical protein